MTERQKVGVDLEANVGQAARELDRFADSLDKIGDGSKAAQKETDKLTGSLTGLDRAQRARAASDERVKRLQSEGLVGTQAYTRAIDEQRKAYTRLASEMKAAQTTSERISRSQQSPGRTSVSSIAAGVGIGITAADIGQRAAGATLDFIKGSIDASKQLTESAQTGRQVFGDYERDVEKFGDTAARSVGKSKSEAIAAATEFGVLFKVGQSESAKMSVELVKLSADLAAVGGRSPAAALEAVKGAFTGNFETLRDYGIFLDQAAIKQEAVKEGLIRTTKDALTPAASQLATYNLVMQQGASAQGQFAARSRDLAVKQLQTSAAIKDAQTELGKGLVPAMVGAAQVADGTLIPVLKVLGQTIGFIGEHDATRHLAELALLTVGLAKAVDVAAAAYGRLTGAATAAAVAETAAAGAGAGGGAASKGLLVGALRTGAVGLGTKTAVGASLAAIGLIATEAFQTDQHEKLRKGAIARGRTIGFGYDSRGVAENEVHRAGGFLNDIGLGGLRTSIDNATGYTADMTAYQKQQDELAKQQAELERKQAVARSQMFSGPVGRLRLASDAADYRQRQARAYLDSRSYVQDAASVPLRGLFEALPEKPDPSVLANARDAEKSAHAAVAIAEARVKKAREGVHAGAAPESVASARAAVLQAQDAVRRRGGNPEAEALRLQAAQERLNRVLTGGKTNTLGLMTAEKSLADARRAATKATADRHKAEKEASGDKSLSLKEVLNRASLTAKTSAAEAGNVKALVRAGLTEPVIKELEGLEQTAPGTIAKVAKGLTPAYVAQLNKDAKVRTQAALDIARLGGLANLQQLEKEAYAAGKRLGDAVNKGYRDGLDEHGVPKGGPAAPSGPAAKTSNPQPSGLGDFLGQQTGGKVVGNSWANPHVIERPPWRPTVPYQPPPQPSTIRLDPGQMQDLARMLHPVALHLSPVKSEIFRSMAREEIARAERMTAIGVDRQ